MRLSVAVLPAGQLEADPTGRPQLGNCPPPKRWSERDDTPSGPLGHLPLEGEETRWNAVFPSPSGEGGSLARRVG